MSEICVPSQFLLGLLEEIGRARALADNETDIIEAIVCRGHRSTGLRVKWNPKLDRALLRAGITRGGIRRFAEQHNVPAKAAYDRLHKLRKAKATKQGKEG